VLDIEPSSEGSELIVARLRAVQQLIQIFRVERYIYLSISILSFVVMVAFACFMFFGGSAQDQKSLFILLFAAPGGALIYVSAAFLRMWTQALRALGGK
jgi:hypothetical protein